VAVFFGCSLVLLDQNEAHNLPRFVILNVIYAITLTTTIRQCLRALFAPASDHLRLIGFTAPQATYAFRWFSAFSLIIVGGYYCVNIATALHVPPGAVVLFQNFLALILTVMAIVVIFQTRLRVAVILRGSKTPAPERVDYAFRLWLARHWHRLTTAYLIIGLTVTTLEVDHGIAVMLRGTVMTFVTIVLSRISFLALDRWTAPRAGTSLTHRQVMAFLIRPLIWVVAAFTIAASWGFHINVLIANPMGQRVTNAVISIALTLFILTIIYETLNSAIERHLSRKDPEGKTPVASARARTLLPMVRNTVFMLFSGIAMLTFLSAIGINIGPLLAGAGVVGVAIGFGSQSLVKDFLTGLFIVMENTVAVGDIVKIGEFSGSVEAMSVRTIRLRDLDGSLHILPFSEVSKITNMTKGFSYALFTVGVSYGTDINRVMAILREIGADLQEDPIFKRVILEPIEVLGVDSLGDSAILIQSRMRTRPGKQWDIKRQLLLRIVQRFDKEGIDIPFPTVTHLTKIIDTSTPTQPLPL
jgi:small conductance mechanosensitive channel